MPETQYARMAGLEVKPVPADYDPIARQAELQRVIAHTKTTQGFQVRDQSVPAKTVNELIQRTDMNIKAAIHELVEAQEHLPWKGWKLYKDAEGEPMDMLAPPSYLGESLTEFKFELIDVMHFLLNTCIACGMDWAEVLAIFEAKQVENRERQANGY